MSFGPLIRPALVALSVAAAIAPAAGDDAVVPERALGWVRQSEYHVAESDDGLQLVNRAQDLRVVFGPGRVMAGPRTSDGPAWVVELTGSAPRRDRGRPGSIVVATAHGEVVYRNAPDGLDLAFDAVEGRPVARFGPSEEVAVRVAEDGRSLRIYAGSVPVMQLRMTSQGHRLRVVGKEVRMVAGPESAQRVTLAVTGKGAVIASRGLPDTPDWIAEGNRLQVMFGAAVASAGDVNDDGYSDVIIGAPEFDAGAIGEGRAFVFLGSADGLKDQPIWTADGGQQNARFGSAVGSAGDVDGDGHDDVLVGAPFYTGVFEFEGRAYLFLGRDLAQKESPDWAFDGRRAGANLGGAVGGAGDVNGDGFADVVIGAPSFTSTLPGEGAAFVFRGYAQGLKLRPQWAAFGGEGGAAFGNSVAGAGDIDGDGFADVIVGAPRRSSAPETPSREGRVTLYRGSANGLSGSPAWEAFGTSENARFGFAVGAAGDVNGDGFADVIVGIPNAVGDAGTTGRAVVYSGTRRGLAGTPSWQSEGQQAAGQFGIAVSTAGDVNGDGYADVLVGAPSADLEHDDEGQALLFLGGGNGLSAEPDWSDRGGQSGAAFGRAVGVAGDVNGDGFGDVIVGAPGYDGGQPGEGAAFTFHGRPLSLSPQPDWVATDGFFLGYAVGAAGDVNGDGNSDIVVGDPVARTANVWLGAPGGLPAEAARVLAETGLGFGAAVSTAGDIDGDGYADIVVGANIQTSARGGAVYVFSGSPGFETDTEPPWVHLGEVPSAELGFAVASAGDVNGDGFAEVIAGAPGAPNGGAVYMWYGSVDGLTEVLVLEPPGDIPRGFGASVASAGDVNGDGFSDVVVGAPFADGGTGRAFAYLGSSAGLSTTPTWFATGETTQSSFGQSVASAGDVNHDGYSDLVVGAARLDQTGAPGGRAYVYLGSPAGLERSATWAKSEPSATRFAYVVAAAGDINGDGFSDVLVGDDGLDPPGAVWVYAGSPTGPVEEAIWTVTDTELTFGASVGTAGDVNGDGVSDVIVGQPRQETVRVYYGNEGGIDFGTRQLRVDSPQTPIALGGSSDTPDGFVVSAIGRSPAGRTTLQMIVDVGTSGGAYDESVQHATDSLRTSQPGRNRPSFVTFEEEIGGLAEGSSYQWRIRFVSDNPLFPYSPWRSIPSNAITEKKLRTGGDLPEPEFSLIGPAPNEPVFPDSAPLIFSWNAGTHTRFRLDWSSNTDFESRVESVTVPDVVEPGGIGVLVPDLESWQAILQLGRNPDVRSIPIFWRVTPLDGPTDDTQVNPGSIRMQPPQDTTLVDPAAGAEFTETQTPEFTWNANHNQRYRVVFGSTPELTDPIVESEETLDTSLIPTAPTWAAVIELAEESQGQVYWAVFAQDAIGRQTRSDVREFQILLD